MTENASFLRLFPSEQLALRPSEAEGQFISSFAELPQAVNYFAKP
jgi:hypothetical protein